jgi:Fic-DOC domain mobile mystery protein B
MKVFEYSPGATPLNPDELEGLKLRHITTCGELDRWEQENIQEAFNWLGRRRKTDILTEEFLCLLHDKMFNKIWRWSGSFRRTDKNIGGSWMYVGIELRNLLGDVNFWIVNNTYPPDEIAFRFHHRLVLIHLFPNGNGRHSRLITDLLLSDIFKAEPFTWGSGDLSNIGDVRQRYIAALRAADKNEYRLLSEFVRT